MDTGYCRHLSESVPATEAIPFEADYRQRLSAETVDHCDLTNIIQEIIELRLLSDEWKRVFEQAYERIPANKRIIDGDVMVFLYCELEDFEMDAKFLLPKPYPLYEIVMSLEILGRLKRYDEAAEVVKICRKGLKSRYGKAEKRMMRKAIRDISRSRSN
jgi:hypothetical protein